MTIKTEQAETLKKAVSIIFSVMDGELDIEDYRKLNDVMLTLEDFIQEAQPDEE